MNPAVDCRPRIPADAPRRNAVRDRIRERTFFFPSSILAGVRGLEGGRREKEREMGHTRVLCWTDSVTSGWMRLEISCFVRGIALLLEILWCPGPRALAIQMYPDLD